MAKFLELAGQKFGRLNVLVRVAENPNLWLCRCDCGNEVKIRSGNLRNNHTKSCGCFQRERASISNKTHGKTKTREYRIWQHMLWRCYNPKSNEYVRYGARGITVCASWQNSFEAFLKDMGVCPVGCSIERKNNNKGYEPDNCRWATAVEQAHNTRGNKHITINGECMIFSDWLRRYGLSRRAVYCRLKKGWSMQKAIQEPSQRKKVS